MVGVGTVMKPASVLAIAGCGAMVGFGLALAAMIQPEIVLNFLRLNDFGPLLTLGSAALITLVTQRWAARRMPRPLLEPAFDQPAPVPGLRATIVGAAIAGAGWGLCGLGHGAAIAGLGARNWPLACLLAGLIAGAVAHRLIRPR
jgi:hypothetical protein